MNLSIWHAAASQSDHTVLYKTTPLETVFGL